MCMWNATKHLTYRARGYASTPYRRTINDGTKIRIDTGFITSMTISSAAKESEIKNII